MDDATDNRPHDGPTDGESRPSAAPRRMAGRGGGPPGGSAFGRRQQADAAPPVRRIRATPAPQVVFESLDRSDAPATDVHDGHDDGRFEPVESLFDPSWIGSAASWTDPDDTAFDDQPFDDQPFDDRVVGDKAFDDGLEAPTAERASASVKDTGGQGARRMFPGGHVRLPPLGAAEDHLHFVGTAFVRRNEERTTADRSAFDEYFTFESLFDEPTEESTEDGPLNPYGVLGVEPGSAWRDVVAAHRRLVKIHHPDRLVDADPATIGAAEERLRQINWAYGELGRSRQQ